MNAMPEWLFTLESLTWLGAAFLFALTVAIFFFSCRRFDIRANVRWEGGAEERGHSRKPMLLAALSALGAICLFGISRGETPPVRLALLLIGAGVTWVAFGWAWSQGEAWVREMAEDAESCQEAEGEVTRQLRKAPGSAEELHKAVCELAQSKLGAEWALLLTRNEAGDFSTAGGEETIGASSTLGLAISKGTARAVMVMNPADGRPGPALKAAGGEELARLRSRRAALAVPIRGADAPRGILLLGPRFIREPYAPAQVRLAEEIAALYGECMDWSAVLEERVAEAVRRSEEEQAWRHAAEIRRSMQVADKLLAGGIEVGLSIADGDGGPALLCDTVALAGGGAALFLAELGRERTPVQTAMRAVQLQSLLRSRAKVYAGDLVELVESTHRALLASNPPSPPAALFAGICDASGDNLRYVNCGSYAPMVLRRSDSGCRAGRLLTGGPPLCSLAGPQWEEGEVRLEPGDLIAIPSQSLPAVQNKEGRGLGESKLIEALLGWEDRPCQEMAELVLRSAAEFAGTSHGAPLALLLARNRSQS